MEVRCEICNKFIMKSIGDNIIYSICELCEEKKKREEQERESPMYPVPQSNSKNRLQS